MPRLLEYDSIDKVKEKVYDIVTDQLGKNKSEFNDNSYYVKDLKADSLDTAELVMQFEDIFGISIPDEDTKKIETLGQTVNYIWNKLNK